MITIYRALGLLFILFFLPYGEIYSEESNLNLEDRVDTLITQYKESPEELISQLNTLLKGEDHNYHTLLAGIYINLGKYQEAETLLKTANDYLENPDILEQLINSYRGQGKDPSELFKFLEGCDPGNPMAIENRAWSLMDRGDYSQAENLLLDLYKREPDRDKTLIALGELYLLKVDSLGLQDKKVLSTEEDIIVTSYYEQAIMFYKKVQNTETSYYYNRFASIYKKLGDKLNAIKCLNRAIELDPNDPWNYYDKGKIFFYNGNEEVALENFLKTYKLSPDHFFVNVFLGRIYYNRNNIDKAVLHYTKVLTMNGNYSPAWEHYAILSYVKGYTDISLSYQKDIYNKKIARNSFLNLFLLETLIETGDIEGAKKIASELVKKEKNVTMKGIYNFYISEGTNNDTLQDALEVEDEKERLRLSYYISSALYREGVRTMTQSLLEEVKFSGVEYESKLATYKLGVLYD